MSLAIIFRSIVQAQSLTLREAMQIEFKLCYAIHHDINSDFYEGIRASVVDKDKKPNFKHKRLQDVSEHEVDNYFNPSDLHGRIMPLDIDII